MITYVRLKNWRSHRDTELRFGDGTNILVGGMGTGKSSVLEAITMGLFGTTPDVKMRKIKLEDLIRGKPEPAESSEVEVGFVTPEGEEYVVKRVIRRGEGTAFSELRKVNGGVIESPSSSRVTELVQSLLGMDYDLFERAVYAQQNRLDLFLILPVGKRREKIDELMGMDKLEEARRRLGSLSRGLADRAQDRERLAAQLRQDSSIALLPTYVEEAKNLEASLEEAKSRFRELRSKLEEIEAPLREMEDAGRRLGELERAMDGKEGEIRTLKRRVDEIRAKLGPAIEVGMDELEREYREAERASSEALREEAELNSELNSAMSKVGKLEARLSMLEENRRRLEHEMEEKRRIERKLKEIGVDELSASIERIRSELNSLRVELTSTRERVNELESSVEELAEAGSTCPVCESPLEEGKKRSLMERRRREVDEKKKRIPVLEAECLRLERALGEKLELQEKVRTMMREVDDLPRVLEEHGQVLESQRKVNEELREERVAVEDLRARLQRVRGRVEDTRTRLSDLKSKLELRSDLQRQEAELRRKKAEGLNLQREIWEIKKTYSESKLRELKEARERLISRVGAIEADIRGKEKLVEERKRLIKSIEDKVFSLRRSEVEARYFSEAATALNLIQTALSRTQVAMRVRFVDLVNQTMADLWDGIYPYGDYTSVRLSVGAKGDYVLELRDRRGNWVPVEGVASGGERTDACLVMRIAFALALAPRLSWIVLDEPTHNLDSEGIQELAKVLRERLPELIRQVLLITHEERLEAAVSGYLYRFYRDKNKDEPTRVEQVIGQGSN